MANSGSVYTARLTRGGDRESPALEQHELKNGDLVVVFVGTKSPKRLATVELARQTAVYERCVRWLDQSDIVSWQPLYTLQYAIPCFGGIVGLPVKSP